MFNFSVIIALRTCSAFKLILLLPDKIKLLTKLYKLENKLHIDISVWGRSTHLIAKRQFLLSLHFLISNVLKPLHCRHANAFIPM